MVVVSTPGHARRGVAPCDRFPRTNLNSNLNSLPGPTPGRTPCGNSSATSQLPASTAVFVSFDSELESTECGTSCRTLSSSSTTRNDVCTAKHDVLRHPAFSAQNDVPKHNGCSAPLAETDNSCESGSFLERYSGAMCTISPVGTVVSDSTGLPGTIVQEGSTPSEGRPATGASVHLRVDRCELAPGGREADFEGTEQSRGRECANGNAQSHRATHRVICFAPFGEDRASCSTISNGFTQPERPHNAFHLHFQHSSQSHARLYRTSCIVPHGGLQVRYRSGPPSSGSDNVHPPQESEVAKFQRTYRTSCFSPLANLASDISRGFWDLAVLCQSSDVKAPFE